MAVKLLGRLVATQRVQTDLTDCTVELTFHLVEAKPPRARGIEAKGPLPNLAYSRVVRSDPKGAFVCPIPDKVAPELIERVGAVASNPAGISIGKADAVFAKALEAGIEIPIDVDLLKPIELPAAPAPEPDPVRRIRGLVIDRDGTKVPAGTQVIISGIAKHGKTGDQPLLAARTDASGYFIGTVPSLKLEAAQALVAGQAEPQPIALGADGMIPTSIVVVIDQAAPAPDSNCDCSGESFARTPTHEDIAEAPGGFSVDLGTGGCIQFNVPNRSLEEFDFYTVVRTTEPPILGFNFDAPPLRSLTGPIGSIDLDPRVISAKNELDLALNAASAAAAQLKSSGGGSEAQAKWDAYSTKIAPRDQETSIAHNVIESQVAAKARSASWSEDDARTTMAAQLHNGVPSLAAGPANAIAGDWAKAVASLDKADIAKDQTHYHLAHEIFWNKYGAAQAAASLAGASGNELSAAEQRAKAAVAEAEANYQRVRKSVQAERDAATRQKAHSEQKRRTKAPGRVRLDAQNPIDWDDSPTFFQAAEVAHGHLLRYKQTWYADGYSLGDLLYSLPLAPGQKKLISVVDWERREATARNEDTSFGESLESTLARDRDLGEVVRGALTESSRGGSKATTAGVGVGTGSAANGSYQGINFGALIGVSAGYGQADSTAWQDSAKNLSASSLQNLRDTTMQSASAVRSLRSTVINTASQGEAVRATTEVVANHNHCHAMTVQYFEVLRHFKLEQDLVSAQECLFVPLPMSAFDVDKALRWREELNPFVKRRQFDGAFNAARRVATNWEDCDLPLNEYGDEFVESISGELIVTISIPAPPFPEKVKPDPADSAADAASKVAEALLPTEGVLGAVLAIATGGASLITGMATQAAIKASQEAAKGAKALAQEMYELSPQERYAKYHHDIAPGVVEGFINTLRLSAKVNGRREEIGQADFTLVSAYSPGKPLEVAVSANISGRWRRNEISQLMISAEQPLPTGGKAILNSAELRYRTASFEHVLITNPKINDDIEPAYVATTIDSTGPLSQVELTAIAPAGKATLYTPIDSWEQRNPRKEDRRQANELISHLNDNLEYYHHAIWWAMDPNRRYLLLDGFHAPNSGGRSLASVIENRLIGIVGNSLILPVAPGISLDPRFAAKDGKASVDLLAYYRPDTPMPPTRVSLPTRGVFAEAVMGNCNSCEQIDDSRFWRWEESPIDEPPQIEPISMSSRRAEPVSGAPSTMPTPIVNIQNAPAAPDPAGISGVLDQLGKQTFADITGLAGNQANAAAAYQQALDSAFKFGKEASTLAQQAALTKNLDRTMSSIDKAEAAGGIKPDTATQLRTDALRQVVGTPASSESSSTANQPTAATSPLTEAGAEAIRSGGNVTATTTYPDGTSATVTQTSPAGSAAKIGYKVDGITPLKQPEDRDNTCWAAVAAMMTGWRSTASNSGYVPTIDGEIAKMGGVYASLYANNQTLSTAQKDSLLIEQGMMTDASVSLLTGQPREFESLMRSYGPLWATVDVDATSAVAPHAKLVFGIEGDGTHDGTLVWIVDPRTGEAVTQVFSQFAKEFEALQNAGAAAGGAIASIVRFTQTAGGEGTAVVDPFDLLTTLVQATSMSLPNVAGGGLSEVKPWTTPMAVTHSVSHASSGKMSPSSLGPLAWAGTTEVSDQGLKTLDLKHDLEMTHPGASAPMIMKMTVLEEMSWSKARLTQLGQATDLPLTRDFLIAEHSGNAALTHRVSALFPLKATIGSYATLVFGYVIEPSGTVSRLDVTRTAATDLAAFQAWLEQGGSGASGSTVVVGVYDLSLNDPYDDYQPKLLGTSWIPGIAEVARMYPLLSFWCSKPCDQIEAQLDMTRPAVSGMPGMWNSGAIAGGLFTDFNGSQKTLLDEYHENRPWLSPAVAAMPLVNLLPYAMAAAPSVRWDGLFSYYQVPANSTGLKAVDRSRPARASAASDIKRWDLGSSSYVNDPRGPVLKVAHQGAYDNIHIAPAMDYFGAKAVMAPVCHHDCFHMHWRWTDTAPDQPVSGWSGGLPYAKPGAPMIPENQDLWVDATGTSVTYKPVASRCPAKTWQIFCHHGAGYLTAVTAGGEASMSIELATGQPNSLPPSWEAFYYHNRYQEVGGTSHERLDVSLFPRLEGL